MILAINEFKKRLSENFDNLSKATKECQVFFVPFGYLLIIGYLGFYYFNLLIAVPSGYENIAMRVTVAILGLGLVLHKHWMSRFQKIVPIYWYFTLIYSLPFFFFFMLFSNPGSNIWQINGLVGMATLTFFVDWPAYIVLTIIGTSMAYVIFYVIHGVSVLPLSLLGILGSYSAPVIYLVLFSHRRKQLYKDKLLAEEKDFNAKLLKQSADLKKALIIKNEFLNNISHEVRTPINGVVNISELLVDNWYKYSEKERYDHMRIVAQSGKRLLMLMNNILDLSKFESGKMVMQISRIDLEKIIENLVEESKLLYLHNNSNLTIETSIQSNLDAHVNADSERITQVLRNLIGNSIKFTSKGKIRIQLQKQGNYLEIIIRDEGLGIPENELEEIFSPFVQSSRTKNKAGGTGLGLAICKDTIEAHFGKIWAENNQDKGSSFHILLPKSEYKSETIQQKRRGKIMVIDDEPICHSILSLIFKSLDYEMISVYGGKESLDYLRKVKDSEISIIFLDLMMPDMYGMNVLKEIKSDQNTKNIPIIIQSASYDISEREKSVELGAIAFLKKPYEREKIIELLKQCSYNA